MLKKVNPTSFVYVVSWHVDSQHDRGQIAFTDPDKAWAFQATMELVFSEVYCHGVPLSDD
jgi:hypothetical protein